MPALSKQINFVIQSTTGTNVTTSTSVAIPSAAYALGGSNIFNSIKEKGDGYFGSADGLHTVTYTVTPQFIGTLTMQASLATEPTEADWFNVKDTEVTYIQPNVPASTTTSYVNFVGNFVWVRAKVHRGDEQTNGSVLFINYNH